MQGERTCGPVAECLITLPNLALFFGLPASDDVGPFEVVHSFVVDGLAKIYITRIGAFGFSFDSKGPLGFENVRLGKERFEGNPSNSVSPADGGIDLRERQIAFANFVAAGVFGRHAGRARRALVGARYTGLDSAFEFTPLGLMRSDRVYEDGMSISDFGDDLSLAVPPGFFRIVGPKIEEYLRADNSDLYLRIDEIRDCAAYIDQLISRSLLFHYADLQSSMRMNYQALVLHDQQHPEASLALNAVVMETLVSEMFFSYGLVGSREPRTFATRPHGATKVSNSAFGKMRFVARIEHLRAGGLIGQKLFERINLARLARNELMHKGASVSSELSLDCQKTTRDLWAYLVDMPFGLIAKPS